MPEYEGWNECQGQQMGKWVNSKEDNSDKNWEDWSSVTASKMGEQCRQKTLDIKETVGYVLFVKTFFLHGNIATNYTTMQPVGSMLS